MPRHYRDISVFDMAVNRMVELYGNGHRVVVSFSAGKDSGICLEVCLIAARMAGHLPLDVVMRDEEIMFPGTFEYAERVAQRLDVNFHWIIANQPVINVFNRAKPYFWVFDPLLKPEEWVRQPPDRAEYIKEQDIQNLITLEKFPPAKGKELFSVIGLRVSESMNRRMGIYSSKGYLTKPDRWGVRRCRPIFDWGDGDVWKAVNDNGWDYNHAYDSMHRLGLPRHSMRIAPPTLTAGSIKRLHIGPKAWPRWFDKVCERLPGVRTAVKFGRHSVEPIRNLGESWEECFWRECVTEAPEWIAERAKKIAEHCIKYHAGHSNTPFPQTTGCHRCGFLHSWRALANQLYMGDPFSMKLNLPPMEPEYFRKGAGTWGKGSPTW